MMRSRTAPIQLAFFVGFALAIAAQAANPEALSFRDPTGVKVLHNFSGTPDADGVVATFDLEIGPFDVACYWAPFQKYDRLKRDEWYDGVNRLQPLGVTRIDKMKQGGQQVIFRLPDGRYLAVLPLTGPRTMGWLDGSSGKLLLHLGNLGTTRVDGDLPVVAWSRNPDPYTACRTVWELAVQTATIAGRVKLRHDKPIPQFLNYLGFGTWEEYRGNYDAQKLVSMIRDLNASGVPVRWIQIGQGHHDTKPAANGEKGPRLNSFRPTPKKFPDGWAPVMKALTPNGVTWLGLFQVMSGPGVHPENDLGPLNNYLMKVPGGQLEPKNSPEAAAAFYEAMLRAAAANGFTFIKMDFQTPNTHAYIGTPDPVGAATNNEEAYQKAAEKYLAGTINCMAHNPLCLFNTRNSNVTRVSEDYKKRDLAAAIRQIHNCYGNLPVIGQTCWGDFDMFHSSDAVSGHVMAIAKAVSGGTIYLSDKVSEISRERALPLCYKDGRTLRPLAPPAPLLESLFLDPFASTDAYRAIAPLPNNTAAILAYNLTEPQHEVKGHVGPADYAHASAMMQPYPGPWPTPREGLLLYDWHAGTAEKLDGDRPFTLKNFNDDRFFLLCPIIDGWAIIGRTDKYLSPAAVEVVSRTPNELVLKMTESGPLAVWSATGNPHADSLKFQATNGLLKVDVKPGESAVTVRITR